MSTISTIYIVRHGETIGNDTKLVMHPDQDVLNEAGQNMAKNLGKTLQNVNFTKVYTSSYPRTMETASLILSENLKATKVPTATDQRLREVDIENSYGAPYAVVLGALMKFLQSNKPLDEFVVNESEPIPEIRTRTKNFLLDLIRETSDAQTAQTILVVSHGACIRLLLEHFMDVSLFTVEGWSENVLRIARNTACTKLVFKTPSTNGEKVHVIFEQIHDTSHIPKNENDSLARLVNTPEGKCLSGCFQV